VAAVLGLATGGVAGWGGVLASAAGIGLLTGSLAHERQQLSCAATWTAGSRRSVLVRVHDRVGPRGLATGTVLASPDSCRGDLLLRAATGTLPPGGRALLVGSFRAPALLHVERARTLRGSRQLKFLLRDALGRRIGRLYGSRAPLVEALVLNRRDDLDPRWRRVFAEAGIAHLLAISGLHVGIIAAWTLLLARRLLSLRAASQLTAVVVWAYVGLLGYPAPAVRSAAFISLMVVAGIRQRHPPADAILAATVLAVVVLDPLAAGDVGAWLSVTATWGTGYALRRLPPAGRRRPVVSLLAASLGATLATAPITALVFGTVAPVGLLTNLVVVPLSAVAVPGIFASLVLGAPVAAGTGLVLAGIERSALLAAAVPGGQIQGTPGERFAALWMLVLLAGLWICRPRQGGGAVGMRAAVLAAATAWVAVIVPAVVARGDRGGVSLYVLDVGQGDAVAVRTPRGRWMLIDAGPRSPAGDAGRTVVLPFLRRHGVRRLDLVMASHGHDDHVGGLPAVLAALTPELMLDPGQPLGTPQYLDLLRAADAAGTGWRAARAGDTVRMDSVTLAVLHPTAAWVATHLDPNENSLVVHLTYRDFDALLTGDAGLPAESLLVRAAAPSEVLKVGHHGSAGATGEAWLDVVRPTVAVISVGTGNRYGHPAPSLLRRLGARGIDIYRTDRGGTVTIHTDGRYFDVSQQPSVSWLEDLRCLIRGSLPSSGSSWSRNACIPPRRASFPTSSTTSRSPARSSPDTSGGRVW
jgi:competence protein ComEC